MKDSYLVHHGVKGMKWGVRRTPEQLGRKRTQKDLTLSKGKNSYSIKDKNGSVVSKLSYYDYKIKGFDWVLISDVDTKPSHRKQGLATKLMDKVYYDVTKKNPNKGLYMFVKQNNENAIRLYDHLGYKTVKPYNLKDGLYYIMAKGNADVKQFDNMSFS